MRAMLKRLAVLASLVSSGALPAFADECSPYAEPPYADKSQAVVVAQQPIDSSLLIASPDAIRCLVEELRKLRPRIAAPQLGEAEATHLVRLTGAARTILVNRGIEAITDFRNNDNLDVVAVLAFAARSDNQSARVNATRVLSDVIDNTTVCVALDHLYDPEIDGSDFGRSGRVNLLGVISVVAPWAYKENFENMERLVRAMRERLRGEADAGQSFKILENIIQRMRYQDILQNRYKDLPLPADQRECAAYNPLWANASGQNLTY